MIDQAQANAIKPPDSPEQVPLDLLLGEEIHHGLEFQAEGFYYDRVAERLKAAGRRSKNHAIA